MLWATKVHLLMSSKNAPFNSPQITNNSDRPTNLAAKESARSDAMRKNPINTASATIAPVKEVSNN